ncbi:hypothetical protein [Lysobacter gummosus]|uniref:hypothetical protein n=1 Tax=Lysobacter gummosus TaxID=262324 RepID=UPI003641FAA4
MCWGRPMQVFLVWRALANDCFCEIFVENPEAGAGLVRRLHAGRQGCAAFRPRPAAGTAGRYCLDESRFSPAPSIARAAAGLREILAAAVCRARERRNEVFVGGSFSPDAFRSGAVI